MTPRSLRRYALTTTRCVPFITDGNPAAGKSYSSGCGEPDGYNSSAREKNAALLLPWLAGRCRFNSTVRDDSLNFRDDSPMVRDGSFQADLGVWPVSEQPMTPRSATKWQRG